MKKVLFVCAPMGTAVSHIPGTMKMLKTSTPQRLVFLASLLAAGAMLLLFGAQARAVTTELDSYAALPDYVPDLSTYFTANGFNGSPNMFNMPLVVGDPTGDGLIDLEDVSVYGEVTDLSSYQTVAASPLTVGTDYMTNASGQLAALPGYTFYSDAGLTDPYADQEILVTGIESAYDDALKSQSTVNIPPGWQSVITVNFTEDGVTVATDSLEYQNEGTSAYTWNPMYPVPSGVTANDIETKSVTKPIPPTPEPPTILLFGLGLVSMLVYSRRRTNAGA